MKGNEKQDQIFRCIECDSRFLFSAGEQAFFASKGLSTPKRCKACRLKRKNTLVRDEGEADGT